MKLEKEKGASDFLAYYIHRPLENRIVYGLLDTRITPNQLTILTNAVAYCVTALFLWFPFAWFNFVVCGGFDGWFRRQVSES